VSARWNAGPHPPCPLPPSAPRRRGRGPPERRRLRGFRPVVQRSTNLIRSDLNLVTKPFLEFATQLIRSGSKSNGS
jgi:hypothetical protein